MRIRIVEYLDYVLPDNFDHHGRPKATPQEWAFLEGFLCAWRFIPAADQREITALFNRRNGAAVEILPLAGVWAFFEWGGEVKFEFSWALLDQPPAFQRAVALHELAHAFDVSQGLYADGDAEGWREWMADMKANIWMPGCGIEGPLTKEEVRRRRRPGNRYWVPGSSEAMEMKRLRHEQRLRESAAIYQTRRG